MADSSYQVSVSRRIAAPADQIFALLARPDRHIEFDGSGMLRGTDTTAPITAVGDRFVMRMYFDRLGGDYVMDNHVVDLEPDRRIAWAPAAGDERAAGENFKVGVPAGHRWVFELAPDGDATVVTETYDCTGAPEGLRQAVGNGQIWREAMEATLSRLEEICTG